MKRIRIMLYAVLLTAAVSCDDGKLLRTDEYDHLAESFDKVFPIVYGNGTGELHTMIVMKDGKIIYERSDPAHSSDGLHILWSASKTFTATAVGFAVQDGLLSVNDRLVDVVPELCPACPQEYLTEVTIWNLLTMSSGLAVSPSSADARRGVVEDWARETLEAPMLFRPGYHYNYNSMDSYMLSVIVSKVTGMSLEKYLEKKLFRPLGIREWHYDVSPQGYNSGGWGLFLSAESMAKMCQFMLDRGVWKGKRLLDENWFDSAMSPQIMQYRNRTNDQELIAKYKEEDDWNQGYGYQMWCCRHGAYRLDGAWSQFGIIIPDKNAVVVTTAHCGNNKLLLNAIWEHVYDKLP